ncbi:MAG: hemolysin family protein [Bacillota bacterium]|nr:hemolysin family protein [Bacillota bacterium]
MEVYIGLVLSIFLNLFLIAKIGGKLVKGRENTVTQEEIRQMVDAGGDNGSIDENEKEMINNIFELTNISAGSIATHRTDIVAVPLDASLEDIKNVTEEEKFSRIVVYDENIDNIVGVYHVKDMVKYILQDVTRMEEGNFHLEDLLMEPYFVPFSKKVDELLEEMQLEKVHMAIVIDEYGGTAGIVTMEDIMEEIFGNIFDEYDEEEEEDIMLVEENVYRINGSTDLQDVEEILQIVFEEEADYDTLGGYLIGQLGRIPEEDESIEIPLCGWLFSVEAFEEKRIMKVIASKMPEEAAAEDADEDNKED